MKVFAIWFVILFIYLALFGESRNKNGITRWFIVIASSFICTLIYAPITLGIIYFIKLFIR